MSASEARAALPAILDRVMAGEEVTITRHGQPVAVVVRPDALRVRRAAPALAVLVDEVLANGRQSPLADSGALTAARAESLVAEVRAGRDGRPA